MKLSKFGRRYMRRTVAACGVAMVSIALVAGCGSSADKESAQTDSPSSPADSGNGDEAQEADGNGSPEESAGSAPADAGGLITIIVKDPSNPFWKAEGDAAGDEATKLGYEANVVANEGDTNKESQIIDAAIANKAVAILLDPADMDGSVGAVKKAVDAGIPVITMNDTISDDTLVAAQLASDNAQGAEMAANHFAELMGDAGSYLELYGDPSTSAAHIRSDTFEATLESHTNLERAGQEVANWDRTQGLQKTEAFLQANPNITGILSGNDEMALGAYNAADRAGLAENIIIGGFDGSPASVEAVADGRLAYTIMQPVTHFARLAVQQADSLIRTGSTGVDNALQYFPCILITPDNVGDVTGPFEITSG